MVLTNYLSMSLNRPHEDRLNQVCILYAGWQLDISAVFKGMKTQ